MILRTFKSHGPLNFFLFTLIGILFWLRSFLHPATYNFFKGENSGLLYSFIDKITRNFPLLQVILSLIIVLFIAFLIQQISSRYALLNTRTRLPLVIYIIIVGGFVSLHTLHPVQFAAVFILFGINSLFSVFNNPEPKLDIFNAGFFIAIATLFYLNALIILPAFLIAISVLRRERNWREYFIVLIGYLIPFLFAASYAFFTDRLSGILADTQNNILLPVNLLKNNYPMMGYLSLLILLTIIGSVKIMQQYDTRKVSTRKYYQVFFIIFVFSMISFLFVPATSLEILIISALPVTFLISNLLVSIVSVFWRELLFIMLLATAILMQFAGNLVFNG